MLRFLWLAVVAITITLPLSLLTIIVALIRSTSPIIEWIVHVWARSLVWAAGVKLHTENMERIDPAKRYILVANHYSYLDIPCIFTAVPQPIRFMAKISLFKIPVFGWALARAGFIPIDRKNRRSAVKSFELAAERIRKGNTIVIFPEEGRTRHREMREFQRGAFLLAIKSGRTIVPVAIDSTYDIWPAGRWGITPGKVMIRVGTPIETEHCTVRDKERLLTEAHAQIQEMLFPGAASPPAAAPVP